MTNAKKEDYKGAKTLPIFGFVIAAIASFFILIPIFMVAVIAPEVIQEGISESGVLIYVQTMVVMTLFAVCSGLGFDIKAIRSRFIPDQEIIEVKVSWPFKLLSIIALLVVIGNSYLLLNQTIPQLFRVS